MHQRGLTLAELLMVITIIGILLALGAPSYLRWQDTSSIRQAQAIIAAELISVRTGAKRANAAHTVTWTSSTLNGRGLDGVAITEAPQDITDRAPYGTLKPDVSGALPTSTLILTRGGRAGVVRVAGMFGKAISGQCSKDHPAMNRDAAVSLCGSAVRRCSGCIFPYGLQ